MKVNDPNLTASLGTGSIQSGKTGQVGRAGNGNVNVPNGGASQSDDVHLSELVRSLRSLAADSPERQAKIEQLTRAYADGSYKPDAEATASAMIDDATRFAGDK